MMVEQTAIYYHLNILMDLKVTLPEMKSFVGRTLLMSALGYPRIRQNWDNPYKLGILSNALPRDR